MAQLVRRAHVGLYLLISSSTSGSLPANLQRLEVLKLPVVLLQRHGFVMPAHPADTMPKPEAVDVGPDGTALAVWRFLKGDKPPRRARYRKGR